MAKYVDKDALVQDMKERLNNINGCNYIDYQFGYELAIRRIENAPEINELGILHGHWIGKPISGYADCKCSVCGAICNVHVSAGIPTQRYCYKCGALMLEDE